MGLLNQEHIPGQDQQENVDRGSLECRSCKRTFPIIDGIPRFVSLDNYTNNFGFQWNLFKKTQLDSHTKTTISKDRFFHQSGWKPDEMRNSLILDVGCGAGRFAEVALSTGANVVAIDYSGSVDACWGNLKENKNLHVVQADLYRLPFKPNLFDYAYSFGVLQHTPDVKKAFFALIEKIKGGGKVCVDFYRKDWKVYLWPKYWLRPITKNLSSDLLFKLVKVAVPLLLPVSSILIRCPLVGHYLRYIIPVVNYERIFPLNKQQLFEWAVLDTFDMFSPKYDYPQHEKTVGCWFKAIGLLDADIFVRGLVVGRGTKP